MSKFAHWFRIWGWQKLNKFARKTTKVTTIRFKLDFENQANDLRSKMSKFELSAYDLKINVKIKSGFWVWKLTTVLEEILNTNELRLILTVAHHLLLHFAIVSFLFWKRWRAHFSTVLVSRTCRVMARAAPADIITKSGDWHNYFLCVCACACVCVYACVLRESEIRRRDAIISGSDRAWYNECMRARNRTRRTEKGRRR